MRRVCVHLYLALSSSLPFSLRTALSRSSARESSFIVSLSFYTLLFLSRSLALVCLCARVREREREKESCLTTSITFRFPFRFEPFIFPSLSLPLSSSSLFFFFLASKALLEPFLSIIASLFLSLLLSPLSLYVHLSFFWLTREREDCCCCCYSARS